LSMDPACEGREEEMPRRENKLHDRCRWEEGRA
jgi:hypothetical protein